MTTLKNTSKKSHELIPKNNKLNPCELVRTLVQNKHFHVSEEDMANLDTSISPSVREIDEVTEKVGDKNNDNTATSYDILPG